VTVVGEQAAAHRVQADAADALALDFAHVRVALADLHLPEPAEQDEQAADADGAEQPEAVTVLDHCPFVGHAVTPAARGAMPSLPAVSHSRLNRARVSRS